MKVAGRKHHEQRTGDVALPELKKAPADKAALREVVDMLEGVGARIKELSGTLASLGAHCAQTAALLKSLGDVYGRSFATSYVGERLSTAVRALQTETEQVLFTMKSVKLGKTLKELHALAAWVEEEAHLVFRHASSEPRRGMTVKCEVWVERDGQAFGKETVELLGRIEEAGSLKGAVAGIKASFGRASRMFHDMERALGIPLLERKVGGASRGGSWLTPEAKDLMRRYEALSEDVEEALQGIYTKHFG